MLSRLKVQRFKSLFDTEVKLEPLTVFIGPNGSGKSNICEALFELSNLLNFNPNFNRITPHILSSSPINKVWQGKLDYLFFEVSTIFEENEESLGIKFSYSEQTIYTTFNRQKLGTHKLQVQIRNWSKENLHMYQYMNSPIDIALRKIKIYDFSPANLSNSDPRKELERTGQGIAYSLVDILHSNRKGFDELEQRLIQLVPNIKTIALPREENQIFSLELIDKYSEHPIPAHEISGGTLRLLAFLTALYQKETPSIICFEELENGVHPWLLHKMMELLKIVSTEGINGKPVQVLITTHSPLLLNYVEPYQVRAVELDHEGKTQVHALPLDSKRFQKALEAYDGELGELWFTNVFGGNPE
jgi:predicted ATPase